MPFIRCKTKDGKSGWKYGEKSTWCARTLSDAIKRAITFEKKEKVYEDLEMMRGDILELGTLYSRADLMFLISYTQELPFCQDLKNIYTNRFGAKDA